MTSDLAIEKSLFYMKYSVRLQNMLYSDTSYVLKDI